MLHINHRRLQEDELGYFFLTPDEWRAAKLRPRYKGLRFDRRSSDPRERKNVVGVGDVLMTAALNQARNADATLTTIPRAILEHSLHIFRISDQLTVSEQSVRAQTVGVAIKAGSPQMLRDWELVLLLNGLVERTLTRLEATESGDAEQTRLEQDQSQAYVESRLSDLDLPFKFPTLSPLVSVMSVS
jgi:hypothetical protein